MAEDAVPGFKLDGLIGEGGMGLVYRAIQHKPRRVVALKLLRYNTVSSRGLRRFEREAEILAKLQHPGIASIYQTGVIPSSLGEDSKPGPRNPDPTPYFAMELVEGVDLIRYADRAGLSTRSRLELFAAICDAIEYAHQQGVIHRDLKPANILIDHAGNPKVLDFGIARVIGRDPTLTTMHTDIGQLLGTLAYMSPEQVVGDPNAADARSDVYALGVTLYKLLSGQLPYDVDTPSLPEAARVIRDAEPDPLSRTNRTLRGDIETIVGRCLEKEPHRRYPSAEAIAEDIRRHLTSRPIQARPPSGWYQATRFTKRNKILVAGLAAVFISLVLGMVGTSLGRTQAIQAQRSEAAQRANAEQQRLEAEAAAQRAQASERSMSRALEEEKRMRALALDRSAESDVIGNIYRVLIGEFDQDVARDVDTTQLVNMLAAGERAADEMNAAYPDAEAELRQSLGRGYLHLGKREEAVQQFQLSYDVAIVSSGPASSLTLFAQRDLAITQDEQTPPSQIVREMQRIRAIARRVGGYESAMHATFVNDLGLSYYADNDLETMHTLMQGFYPALVMASLLDDNSAQTYESIWSRGLLETGRFEEALEVLAALYERRVRVLGMTHGDTLDSAYNLAFAYLGTSRAEQAGELLELVLPQAMQLYQRNPSRYLQMRRMLGRAYYLMGESEKAISIFEVLYKEAVDRSAADHPDALSESHHLALALMQDQQYVPARDRFDYLLVQAEARLGSVHLHTINTLSSLARCHLACGDFAKASAQYQEAVNRYQSLLGPDHIGTLRERRMQAVCASQAGDHDVALVFAEDLLDDAIRVLGDSHATTAKIAVTLGRCDLAAGHPERARRLILEWKDRLADQQWGDAFFLYQTYECLAEACEALGDHEDAQRWRALSKQLHAKWDFPIE